MKISKIKKVKYTLVFSLLLMTTKISHKIAYYMQIARKQSDILRLSVAALNVK